MPDKRGSSIAVPGLGDPDRKRALNVLAQRRYREFWSRLRLNLRLIIEVRTKEA
jgi:hypothetical protein